MVSSASDVAILVVSCDRYADLWRPYFHCFFKYWPDCPYPVYLGSNGKAYADPRVCTITIGEDRDYSSNLLLMLDHIPQDWVIATVEDRFISGSVNTPRFISLVKSAQDTGAGYYRLIAESPYAYDSSEPFGEIPKGVRYRVSFTVALWNKGLLKRLLLPGENAWEFERKGTVRSEKVTDRFLTTSFSHKNCPPLENFHSVVKGKWVRAAPGFLRREGLADCIDRRPLLPLHVELYGLAYHWRLAALMALRRHWMR